MLAPGDSVLQRLLNARAAAARCERDERRGSAAFGTSLQSSRTMSPRTSTADSLSALRSRPLSPRRHRDAASPPPPRTCVPRLGLPRQEPDACVHDLLAERIKRRREAAVLRIADLRGARITSSVPECTASAEEKSKPPRRLWIVASGAPRGVEGLYALAEPARDPPEWLSTGGRIRQTGTGSSARWAVQRGRDTQPAAESAAPHDGRWPHDVRLWSANGARWAATLRVLPAPADAVAVSFVDPVAEERAMIPLGQPAAPRTPSPRDSPQLAALPAAGAEGSIGGGSTDSDSHPASSAVWDAVMCAGRDEDLPQSLWVRAPRHPQVSGGPYELAVGLKNRQPVWECCECRLYSTVDGLWAVTDSAEFAYMGRAGSFVASARPHGGTAPHLVAEWEGRGESGWERDDCIAVLEYSGVPLQLWVLATGRGPVTSPHVSLVLGGPYELSREHCNGHPVWRWGRKALYGGRNHLWIVTEDMAYSAADQGCLASAVPHGGAMPHEVAVWNSPADGQWESVGVRVAAAPPSHRDLSVAATSPRSVLVPGTSSPPPGPAHSAPQPPAAELDEVVEAATAAVLAATAAPEHIVVDEDEIIIVPRGQADP
eukprot:TRINITY_DN1022_c3_g1_i1.p1 TRINITY_DN1022_c3_g1~~TRINITY_DN1022_c3_g1_i1.p1  ORF type:complete len:601 (+),score=154.29 TRINITY_DN1022_c3_g1_i1:64-1866(+)